MKRVFTVFMVAFAVCIFCLEKANAEDPTQKAKAFWDMMQSENYQETWALFPGTGKFIKGVQPHGMLLTTYVNEPALKGLESRVKELPKGSILIKENYKPDKTLAAITTMEKTGDGKQDWFWVKYNPDGTLDKMGDMPIAGRPGGCIGCHAASTSGIHNIMTPLPE